MVKVYLAFVKGFAEYSWAFPIRKGSYTSPGRLAVTLLENNTSDPVTEYTRWLDLDLGVARSRWNVGGNQLTRHADLLMFACNGIVICSVEKPFALIQPKHASNLLEPALRNPFLFYMPSWGRLLIQPPLLIALMTTP